MNKENDKQESRRMLILSYRIQEVKPNFVQNFEILGAVVPKESLTQMSVLHLSERWKKEKQGKINHSILLFFYTKDFNPLWVYTKFED